MSSPQPLYQVLAEIVNSRLHCVNSPAHAQVAGHWTECLTQLAKNFLPSGSGVDSGTVIDLEQSTSKQLVLNAAFHHMDENGYYNGWTHYVVRVKANLSSGIELVVSWPKGEKDYNETSDYLSELFYVNLKEESDYRQWLQEHVPFTF